MVRLPCANKLRSLLCPEMAEALVQTDVQDQMQYLKYRMIVTAAQQCAQCQCAQTHCTFFKKMSACMKMKMSMIRFFNQFLIMEIFFCHRPHPRSLSKGEGGRAFVYK